MSFPFDNSACPPFWQNGLSPGGLYNFPGGSSNSGDFKNFSGTRDYTKRSQAPPTITASVVAIKFDSGVVIGAGTLCSYGTLALFRNCQRMLALNKNILVAASGDYGDFQYMKGIMERKIIDEQCLDDGMQLKPRSLHCWLTRVLYNRRSKLNPMWSNYVVAGNQDGEPFLGAVDMLGTAYEDNCIATGMGTQLAKPLFREYTDCGRDIDEAKAKKLVVKCLEVDFYRNSHSFPRYQLGFVTADECRVEGPLDLAHKWG